MVSFDSSLVTVVLGLGATVLAISLFVQVLQEIWKFLWSSRARCYTEVLEDFLGPWARRMTRPGVLPEFQARGPLQFRRLAPTGVLLPLRRAELVEALERTAPEWQRHALRALRREADLQAGQPSTPSPEWVRFQRELAAVEPGGPGAADLRDLTTFLADAGVAKPNPGRDLDAARLLRAFRDRFLAHVLEAERHFERLEQLFEYRWHRRNLKHTFVFGFLVAFFAAQPAQDILRRARALSPEEAVAMAEDVRALYEARQAAAAEAGPAEARRGAPPTREAIDRALSESLLALEAASVDLTAGFNGLAQFRNRDGPGRKAWYLFGCLVTAVLVSFGAPFWNDLLGAVLRLKRGRPVRAGGMPGPGEPGRGIPVTAETGRG